MKRYFLRPTLTRSLSNIFGDLKIQQNRFVMSNKYFPHNWVIIKINGETVYYKVLAGWEGTQNQQSWRVNSGITGFEETDQAYLFYGDSGSCYVCMKNAYGLQSETISIWEQLKNSYGDLVELVDESNSIRDLVFKVTV